MNTKQQTTHTPTPWHISEYPNGYNLEILADDGIVATVRGTSGTVGETKANADFIVRKKYLALAKISVDPFARNKRWATHTNDLNPNTAAQHHMDAQAFLNKLASDGNL